MGLRYARDTALAQEAKRIAEEARDRWYPDLSGDGTAPPVTLCVMLAYNEDEDGRIKDEPPLTDGDMPVMFKAKVCSLIERSDYRADVQILIDGHFTPLAWTESLPDAQKMAIVDQALAYFEVQRDQNNCIKQDTMGRPKLRVRGPDFWIKGHEAVIRRHGEEALSVMAYRDLERKLPKLLAQSAAPLYAGAV